MSSDTFYNQLELRPPPTLTFKFCCKNPGVARNKMKDILSEAINVLKDQDNLHRESATLSRFVYIWKLRLRSDKGFKALEKVNRSLLQYLALDILSVLQTAHDSLFDDYGPSRQMIEWVLVRLQGFSKLFDNIYSRCIEAATYLQWRFQNGHLWGAALVGTAVVSRIWVLAIYLIKESCIWYSELKQMLPVLQASLQPWLPVDYKFPEDLTTWLGCQNYLINPQTLNSKAFDFINQIPLGEGEVENANVNTKNFDFLSSSNKMTILEDIGEVITRKEEDDDAKLPLNNNELQSEEMKSSSTNFNKSKKRSKKRLNKISNNDTVQQEKNNISHLFINESEGKGKVKLKKTKKNKELLCDSADSDLNPINKITSIIKLKKFLKREKLLRKLSEQNINEKNCLTHNLDKMQWRMFENFVNEKIKEFENQDDKKNYLENVKDQIKTWLK